MSLLERDLFSKYTFLLYANNLIPHNLPLHPNLLPKEA